MARRENAQKVVVAMSGGLDSSVAAALLKEAGFDVIGVFMKFWSEPGKNGIIGASNRCCSPEAEIRARKVARILKIPFYVFNFEKEFKKKVVDYFLKGYKKGITPNPCVVCNKEIKFGLLLEKALKLNADFVATGHYARVEKKGAFVLLKGKDKNKDQSYFLWMLNQNQLKRILFPIGKYTRAEVEKLAKKFKLDFLLKVPKSVEICFVQTTLKDFLKKHLGEKPGKIVNTQREVIGKHKGLWFYTIGQRKGIGLKDGPYYVLKKDLSKNRLVVTKNEGNLYSRNLIVKHVNWIKKPKLPAKIRAAIHYRHRPASAKVIKVSKKNKYRVEFEKPQRAIIPGQSVVFYKGQEVLGGGIICY